MNEFSLGMLAFLWLFYFHINNDALLSLEQISYLGTVLCG